MEKRTEFSKKCGLIIQQGHIAESVSFGIIKTKALRQVYFDVAHSVIKANLKF